MTEEEIKKKLNLEQYRVMREKDTERPYSGKHWDNEENGVYACALCSTVLFTSLAKFDAENGRPSFSAGLDEKYFDFKDTERGMEVSCKKCGSHLGYLVPKEGSEKKYYQVNSASLEFQPIEIELEEEDGSQESGSSNPSDTPPSVKVSAGGDSLLSKILLLAGATVIGALLGGAYGASSCNVVSSGAPLGTTSPVQNVGTSATFVAPKPSNPTTQTSTTVGAPVITTAPSSGGVPPKAEPAASSAPSSDGTI